MQASVRDRLLSAVGTALILALFGYLLFVGMRVDIHRQADRAIALLDLRAPPPPPVHKPKPIVQSKLGHAPSRASPRNLHNKATPIVAPPPLVILPSPSPVIVALKPGTGMAPSNGASNRAGPGEGAGGHGNGLGSGGDGDGDGGGDVGPRQIKGRLKGADIPVGLIDTGREYTVSVRYKVEVTGKVGECAIEHSSGVAGLDALTCNLIQQRFRFDPGHDANRQPFEATIEENHSWEIDPPAEKSAQ